VAVNSSFYLVAVELLIAVILYVETVLYAVDLNTGIGIDF